MKPTHQIQNFILDNLSGHQRDIIKAAISKFGISRQAVLKHMNTLIREKHIVAHGKTKDRYYELEPLLNYTKLVDITQGFKVDRFLRTEILTSLDSLPRNICEISEYALAALLHNVLDHAQATHFSVKLFSTRDETHVVVTDNGVGIFHHIRDGLGLEGKTISAIELAKGPGPNEAGHHAGDDLHAVMMLFDGITIDSAEISLRYEKKVDRWSLQESMQARGTKIHLEISTNSSITCNEIFSKLFAEEKSVVRIPVNLARTNGELLISRNQAHKLVHNIEFTKEVEFDFTGIDVIGPAFAHELVWISREKNKSIDIDWINAADTVNLLMSRAVKRLLKA
jgi:biotin operon repressor